MIVPLLAWCGFSVCMALAMGRALKRRPHVPDQSLGCWPAAVAVPAPASHLPTAHEMLMALDRHDPMLAKAALLRWIGGLSTPAIARALGVTTTAVEHDLQFAKLLLQREIVAAGAPTP